MNRDPLPTGRQSVVDENPFRMAPLQRDWLFSYQTIHGEKWGVRFYVQRRMKSWCGFPNQASAQAFRDELYVKKKTGRLVPEKYYLTKGGELLSTTIDYYLSTIEDRDSAYEERQYGAVWKELFPCATVNSFTTDALQRARMKLKRSEGG